MTKSTKVLIIESEAGWGQRVDEVKKFPSREEAEAFVKEYNNKYNPPRSETPSWYMCARLENDESYGMMR